MFFAKNVHSMMRMWHMMSIVNFVLALTILSLSLITTDFSNAIPEYCPETQVECEIDRQEAINSLRDVAMFGSIAAGIPLFLALFGMCGSSKRSKYMLAATLFFTVVGCGMNGMSSFKTWKAGPTVAAACDVVDADLGIELTNSTELQQLYASCQANKGPVSGLAIVNIVCGMYQLASCGIAVHFLRAGDQVWKNLVQDPTNSSRAQRWWRRTLGWKKLRRYYGRKLGISDPVAQGSFKASGGSFLSRGSFRNSFKEQEKGPKGSFKQGWSLIESSFKKEPAALAAVAPSDLTVHLRTAAIYEAPTAPPSASTIHRHLSPDLALNSPETLSTVPTSPNSHKDADFVDANEPVVLFSPSRPNRSREESGTLQRLNEADPPRFSTNCSHSHVSADMTFYNDPDILSRPDPELRAPKSIAGRLKFFHHPQPDIHQAPTRPTLFAHCPAPHESDSQRSSQRSAHSLLSPRSNTSSRALPRTRSLLPRGHAEPGSQDEQGEQQRGEQALRTAGGSGSRSNAAAEAQQRYSMRLDRGAGDGDGGGELVAIASATPRPAVLVADYDEGFNDPDLLSLRPRESFAPRGKLVAPPRRLSAASGSSGVSDRLPQGGPDARGGKPRSREAQGPRCPSGWNDPDLWRPSGWDDPELSPLQRVDEGDVDCSLERSTARAAPRQLWQAPRAVEGRQALRGSASFNLRRPAGSWKGSAAFSRSELAVRSERLTLESSDVDVETLRSNPPGAVYRPELSNPPPGVYLDLQGDKDDPIGISICT